MNSADLLKPSDTFVHRHLGPRDDDIKQMLATLGCDSLDTLVDQTIPAAIRLKQPLELGQPRGEHEILDELRAIIGKNQVFRSLIGMGYYDCIVPPIIQRNILENPGWYTQYTPYQAEISQGRLEALLNFQTMVADLTGLPLANASLLDEGTAAAEAMTMCRRILKGRKNGFFVANDCHPQTIAVVEQRAKPLDIDLHVGSPDEIEFEQQDLFGILLQYPNTHGEIHDYGELVRKAHDAGALVVVATDLLALALLKPPGEFGADIAVGNSQRFGVPLGFGGPHAAFMATHDKHLRQMPGRIIGVSKDAHGNTCYRMAVQTREQHIRREKATSNICTAQVLLAIMAGAYGVYHGPQGIRRIAERTHAFAAILAEGLKRLGCDSGDQPFFDTLCINVAGDARKEIIARARQQQINLRTDGDGSIGVSLDELTTSAEIAALWQVFAGKPATFSVEEIADTVDLNYAAVFARTSEYMTHPVFNSFHAEHEMLRYLTRLQSRDLSLTSSMIPLGSCTMKLNGTTEMLPITWPEFANIHPFAPADQTEGYREFFRSLEGMLAEITGFPAVSLQPNSGASGEHTGLYVIRAYHESRGEGHRDVSLIPVSAHGTNPASSVMAGCRVVVVNCDEGGNIDVADLKAKAEEYRDNLAALMITYPSTHGVFEKAVKEICGIIHANGGQVYMDGANMNAQVGLCTPAGIGADVCHLNLHKTFAIPHGGGGPGMGPIACADHLAPFLPGHPVVDVSQSPPAVESVAQPPSAVTVQPTPKAKPATPTHRRNLPHIQAEDRPVFVTFRTHQEWVLPEGVRGRVLEHCLHDHGVKMHLHVAVVMPDHVHLVFAPLDDTEGNTYGLAEIMSGIKGASAHSVNKLLKRKGHVWQDESFDRVLRHNECLEEKVEYVCQNPVRKGIVEGADKYPWLWRESVEESQPGAAVPQATQPGAAVPPGTRPGAAVPQAIGPVSAAPWGSPSVLPISWVYIALMGESGLKAASQVAILNANYMARRLSDHYPVLYTGKNSRVAHEFIIDLREFDKTAHITPDDVCKRLMDFGFHAPTMSFPVAGTLMIEPTESESKQELDRLCDALIAIRAEIRAIEDGKLDRENNPLKNAPHTAAAVTADSWDHPYSREQAAYPAAWLKSHKFWPPVGRVDNVYGDRNLFCTCPILDDSGG